MNLGTQKHRDKYLEGISNLKYPGCFAMTELHHGLCANYFYTGIVALFDLSDNFVFDF